MKIHTILYPAILLLALVGCEETSQPKLVTRIAYHRIYDHAEGYVVFPDSIMNDLYHDTIIKDVDTISYDANPVRDVRAAEDYYNCSKTLYLNGDTIFLTRFTQTYDSLGMAIEWDCVDSAADLFNKTNSQYMISQMHGKDWYPDATVRNPKFVIRGDSIELHQYTLLLLWNAPLLSGTGGNTAAYYGILTNFDSLQTEMNTRLTQLPHTARPEMSYSVFQHTYVYAK